MLRCKSEIHGTLYAGSCDVVSVRELSKQNQLICPHCHNVVQFKKGKIKSAHFAHKPGNDCVVPDYENETEEHIRGKEILFEWLKVKFPFAEVELEVYIEETRQIADILVTHKSGDLKGLIWAFEFQHSQLSPDDWKKRHQLYNSINIQDFWVLDANKFLKYSKAKGEENARLRNALEREIFSELGFCYFLDVTTSEFTMDFNFYAQDKRILLSNGKKVTNEYIYHNPLEHSRDLSDIKFKVNLEFGYAAMVYIPTPDDAIFRFSSQIEKIKRKIEIKRNKQLTERSLKLKYFASESFDDDFADHAWNFIRNNRERLKEDILLLPEEEFFTKYLQHISRIQTNISDKNSLEKSDENLDNILVKLLPYNQWRYDIDFLDEQGDTSLKEYLLRKYTSETEVIQYVLEHYDDVLEVFLKYNPKYVRDKLRGVNYKLISNEGVPSKLDYALKFKECCESKEQVDELIALVNEKVISELEKPIEFDFDWDLD